MTENNIPQSPELDFDAWLAGGERTQHFVPLYTRFDLIADIEELENQRIDYDAPAEGDESLGGDEDPNAEINQKIDVLNAQLYASKREFRVSAITQGEVEAIQAEVRSDLSDEIDSAAAIGRAEAKKTAKRAGIVAANDTNGVVRTGGIEESSKVIAFEVLMRKIAFSAKTRFNGEWRELSVDQVKAMHKALGDAQIDRLSEAALSASNEIPEVTVPKS